MLENFVNIVEVKQVILFLFVFHVMGALYAIIFLFYLFELTLEDEICKLCGQVVV